MNDIDFKVIEAFLVRGWSHRKIQKDILKIEAPVRGGGFKAMKILHDYGIKKEYKSCLKNQKVDRTLFSQSNDIAIYLDSLN